MSKQFILFCKITLVTIYLVIIAGTVVRTTGSGMGCPDWPKCFGKWVPPTDESQLPMDYQQIFKDRGYADTTFNVYHTWTEYINRLLGALLGVFVFATFVMSLKYRKINPLVVYLCALEVVLVGFQAWLGALVVSSNLAPFKITIHMVAALVIVAVFIYIITLAKMHRYEASLEEVDDNKLKKLQSIIFICLLFSLVQIVLGTEVRERIDKISFSFDYENREEWVSYIGKSLVTHRTFSLAVLVINGYFFWLVKQFKISNRTINNYIKLLLVSIGLEILAGFILSHFSFPALLQPVHLLLATIVFGVQFYLLRLVRK